MDPFYKEFHIFIKFFGGYLKRHVLSMAHSLEGYKNWLVDLLMFKRGLLQRRVWHGSMIGLSAFGIITSGVLGGQTIIASSFSGDAKVASVLGTSTTGDEPVLNSLYDTHTNISQKPRSEIIDYEVKSGDTISSIAQKFGISSDTIKWANNLEDTNSITPGDKLKILPVSGVAHTVENGDTLESIAKKYSAEQEAILQYPFNDISDDLQLKVGQVLIVPDGTPPTVAAPAKPRPSAPSGVAENSSSTYSAPGGGNFIWPTSYAYISTYFAWWHPGIDLPNNAAPPVVASDGGTVVYAGWDSTGYGNRVDIDHGNGYVTRYGHLSNIYIVDGQKVSRGQTIGQMGSTGRSTGTHLHFEIHFKGVAVNPLAILK